MKYDQSLRELAGKAPAAATASKCVLQWTAATYLWIATEKYKGSREANSMGDMLAINFNHLNRAPEVTGKIAQYIKLLILL